jgi:hypothetical protein
MQAQGFDLADPLRVLDQRCPIGDDGVVDRVPSHPSSTASSLTLRRNRPTCSVTHRPARSVITNRGAAMWPAVSVKDPTAHAGAGHDHRCLCHTSRAGRPNAAMSTSSTGRWSFDHTGPPQPGHTGRSLRVWTCTRTGPPCSSSAPSTVTSPSPTRSSQIRVGSTITGVLGSGWRREPPDSQDPCTAPGIPQPPITSPSDPKRPITSSLSHARNAAHISDLGPSPRRRLAPSLRNTPAPPERVPRRPEPFHLGAPSGSSGGSDPQLNEGA